MGSDSYQNLPKWKNYRQILDNYPVYVYRRPGHESIPDYPGLSIQVVDAPLLQISATLIRDSVRMGKSIRYLVPDKVRDEIERNHYYQ